MNATPKRITSLFVCSTLALVALGGCGGHVDGGDQLGTSDDPLTAGDCPEGVPSTLKPGSDQRLWFVLGATGAQIYQCSATATGPAWTFVAPQADAVANVPYTADYFFYRANEGAADATQCGG